MDKVAIVDLDGTLASEDRAVRYASKQILGKELSRQEVRKLEKSIKSKIYDLSQSLIEYYEPNEEVVNFVKSLKEKGYFIIILTARYDKLKEKTEELLKKIGLDYDKLIMRNEKSHKDDEIWKRNVIREYFTKDMKFFEDKIENLLHLIEEVKNLEKEKGQINKEFYLVVDGYLFKKV